MQQPTTIQIHFNEFSAAKVEKSIYDYDCYNFDKTGFRVDVRQDQWVIIKNESDCLYIKDSKNCEYLSSLEYVGEGRDVFLNMLILSKKQHFKKKVKKNNLDDDVTLAVSDSRYSNNEISLE